MLNVVIEYGYYEIKFVFGNWPEASEFMKQLVLHYAPDIDTENRKDFRVRVAYDRRECDE